MAGENMKKLIYTVCVILVIACCFVYGFNEKNTAFENMVLEASGSISSEEYIGNMNSGKFHQTFCYTLPKAENRVYFYSRNVAVENGYIPCKKCQP